jgi:hypothetical protein
MVRLPSPFDDDFKEDEADSALVKALQERDADAIARALYAGAPFSHHVRCFLGSHFEAKGETAWKLDFKKRRRGRPESEDHRARENLIWREIEETAPMVKDEECYLVLADGRFDSFVAGVIDNLSKKHGIKVARSEVTKVWAKYAEELGPGFRRKGKKPARNPKSA